jgi:hypothetical protein
MLFQLDRSVRQSVLRCLALGYDSGAFRTLIGAVTTAN